MSDTPTQPVGTDAEAPLGDRGEEKAGETAQGLAPLERWNEPRINMTRFAAALLGFIIMGMNDSCLGALLPYLQSYYDINHTVVSTLFIVPFFGYLAAALCNNIIHFRFGQRGVAILGPTTRLVGYIPAALHPPYPALPVVLLFSTFGNGLEDSAWNAWIGNMQSSNELLGILHAAYGLGATIAPLASTTLVAKAQRPWYYFYYIMIAVTVLELFCTAPAFREATGAAYRSKNIAAADQQRTTTRTVLKSGGIPWLLAFFLLGAVGVEVCLSGWTATFMLRIRRADPFVAGITATAFWLGLTLGRLVLGFATGMIGEKLAATCYLHLAIAFELLYWLVPSIAASAVFASFLGFVMGPLFPVAVVAATKLLPPDHHISAIGFAASFASGGGAFLPFAVGAVAESRGVQVLQPFVLATLVFIFVIWIGLPGGIRRGGLERSRGKREPPWQDVTRMLKWAASLPRRESP